MKQLNFLSSLGSQSMGLRSVTLASTVGSPSAHRRSTMLKLISVLVLVLTFGVGKMWGDKLEITYNGTTTGWNITDRGWNSSYWGLCQTTTYCIYSPVISDLSTITSIEVYARTYGTTSGNSNKIGVYGGNTKIGNDQTATSSFQTYTFTPSNLSGSGKIRIQSQGTVNTAGLRVTKVTINYTPSAASHTLSSAVSPAASGSVELSSTSVAEGSTATATATPAAHYVFTSWSISGTGASLSSTTTNPTTVTMGTANATVTANFTQAPKASITLSEAGATTTDATTYYVGDQYTLPSSTEATCSGKVLVGWSTVEVAETNTKPTLNYYEKGAKVTLAATQTFYAVFATAGSPVAATLSATYSSHSGWTASDCCGSSYWILCSGASITSPVISDLSTVTSITFKARTYGGASYNTVNVKTSGNVVVGSASASNTTLTDKTINVSGLTGSGALIFTGSATSNANGPGLNDITIHYQTVSYSKYTTSCCQPLGSINGSVKWTSGEATAKWDDVTGMSSWKLYYSVHNANSWTEVTGLSASDGIRSNTTPISGLTAGQEYDFKVTGTYSGSTYCAQDYTFTFSSLAPKITAGTVSGASSYIVESGPGSKQTFTVSAVGLDDDLTVSAPANFLICDTENGTYDEEATLSQTDGEVAETTLYVQLASGLSVGNNYGGNISISGGGAASVNVAVTGIVSPVCSEPTIDTNPVGATYNMGATATALAVEATKEGTGPALTYQWYSNTANNNTSGSIIEGATNSTYTPSTETAGTKYYYCVVSSGACSASSNVAAIVVNTPIISVGDNKTSVAFGSKAIGSETEEIISISGTTLAKDQNITLALSGAGASAYSLNKYELEASNGTVTATNVTITYTAAAGASEATLTISSEGAASKVITLTGNGKYQATFIANGNTENILVDGEGKLVLPASNPSSCNGTYSTFIGWYSTAAGSNGAPTTNIASCGTKANTHVLESNETYYAVWGNGALSADDVKQVTLDFTSNTDWGFPESTDDAAANEEISYTKGDYTVKIKGDGTNKYYFNSTNNQLLLGKTSGVYLKLPAFDFAVSKIVATEPTGSVSGKITWNVYSGENSVSEGLTGCADGGTFVIDENYRDVGTIYQIQLTNANNLQFKTLEIYSPGAGATGFISSCCSTWDADPVVTYAVPSTWTVGDDAVSVSIEGTTHGTASYESSNPSVISVDAETGAISPVAIGSATITVTWTGGGYCDKAVTTAPVTVHGFVDVTFKKNGGSGTDDQTQSVEVGESTALKSLATLGYGAPDCKEFGGWATSQNGEAVYTDGASISANEATTLWAVWNTKTLSVAQGTGTAVGCEGDAFTFASSVACGGNVTITSSPDATHKAPFTITVLPGDAYEEIDGNVIKNVTKPITSISVSYAEKTSYAITWKVNDAAYAPHQEEEDGKVNGDALVYEGNTITTLPTAPADNTLGCANKFIGWSTHDYKSVKKAASDYNDLFSDAEHAPEIEGATTFYAVFATQTVVPEVEHVISFSRSGTTNTYTTGYTFNATASPDNDGFYKDKSSGVGDLKLYHSTDAFFTSAPSSVTLTAKIGGGSARDPLGNNVRAKFLDKNGNEIGNENVVTTKVLTQGGNNFDVEMDLTDITSVYGVMLYHEKESSYNVRYYSFSLSYTTGGITTTDYVTECAAVEAPTFSVNAGTYNEAQSVELSCATENATIRYTTDGNAPSKTSGTVYNNTAITIDQSMTLKAIAYKGDDESDVAEAAYVLQVVTPTISGTANFVNSTTVTITATGADAIYYTDDDSDPANSGTKKTYSAPFSVESTKTIKAIATKANWTNSNVASETFTKITPMTVATALTNINALDNNGTIADQYVKGIISTIDKLNSDNTITYYISDDGAASSQLQVYHGSAGVVKAAFASADDLKVGEEVVVFGTLKKYKSGSNPVIPEFVNPNEIVAYRPYSPIAWSANAYTAELGGSSNVFPTLSGTAGLTITYTSSDATKASFADASVYEITLNDVTGEDPITITASSAATDDYVATSKSYALTVAAAVTRYSISYEKNGGTSDATDSDGETETNLPNPLPTITKAGYNFGGWYTDNTFETPAVAGAELSENTTLYAQWLEPYTVAEALTKIAALDDNGTTEAVYVRGEVTDVALTLESGNTATYIIKDAGESNSLKVYKGKGKKTELAPSGENITEASYLQEGDAVVLYGQLMKYVKNSTTTPEVTSSFIYSFNRPTYDVTGVTLPSTANVRAGKTITLTATITPSNATNKNVTWSVTEGSAYAEVSNTGVVTGKAEGTATIQVETEDGNFTATCTVTVAGALPNFATDDTHEWIKVTSDTKLQAGRFYVIACDSKGKTMTKSVSGGRMDDVTSTFDDGIIASGDLGSNTAIFELGGTSGAWTLLEVSTDKYLDGTTSSSLSWEDDEATTAIAISEGDATIGSSTSGQYRILYNNGSTWFAPYSSTTNAGMLLPQLYMWAELSHSVTFNANGGVAESVPSVERTDEGKITIPATEPTHSDVSKAFGGWYKSDAPGTLYNAGDEFSTSVDVTLYAKWNTVPTYTVTYVPGGTGTIPAVASYREGQKVLVATVNDLANPGFLFTGWIVKDADQNVLPIDEDNKFTMPASNVTITAGWERQSNQKWALVKQGDELEKNVEYVIVYNKNTKKALGAITTSGTKYGTPVDVTIDGEILRGSNAMTIFTLVTGNGGSNYAFQNGSNYLMWSSGNSLDTKTSLDNSSSWTIEIGTGDTAIITNVESNSRKLRYNPSSPRFACYTSGQQGIHLYKKVANLIVEDEQTKTAAQVDASDITVKENGKLTINVDADEKEIGDITVEDGGELIIAGSKHIKVNNVYISSTMASGKSSQMTGTLAQLDVQGEVYFDITLGDNGNANKWHAFTVPFPVDAINGIYDLDNNKLTNEEHYAIMDYHGDIRATGKYGWKKYRGVLVPGTFYLMTVDGERTTYRFKKTTDGALVAGNSKEIFKYAESGDGQTTDAGWNGVGNPTLMYGKVNAEVQVLDPENYVYVKKDPNSTNFVVGTPFFYQAATAGSISMLTADAGANYAPARVAANGIEKIKVSFGNEEFTDYLDISASEEALNEYQIGKDLAKMTMTSTPKVAQIFGNAYNAKLCMVYAPMVNDKATFDLTLYAPAAGTYTIAAPSMENATLYLTKNGRIYWNLTMGACELDLNQGQNNDYGLVLRAEVPAVTTGVENGELLNGENGVQKVVIDEHVYILRGGEMYDMTGKMVK